MDLKGLFNDLKTDIVGLIEILKLADYFMLDKLQEIVALKIVENQSFIQYTNVRRVVLLNMSPDLIPIILDKIPADILVFVLSDPILIPVFSDLSLQKPVFKQQYADFTKQRIEMLDLLEAK